MGKKDKVAVEFGESIDATDQLLETDLPSLKYEEVGFTIHPFLSSCVPYV